MRKPPENASLKFTNGKQPSVTRCGPVSAMLARRPRRTCRKPPKSLEKLERAKGFEPSTPTLARLCSTPELHPQSNPRPGANDLVDHRANVHLPA